MIRINCDIGERGKDHPVDRALMDHIDIANIACGGHAGNAETVDAFMSLARENDVAVSAHLSYPDKDNFGRTSMVMPMDTLWTSLDEQYSLMPDVRLVKFHGALYNDSCEDSLLATQLAEWLSKKRIQCILAPRHSEMALAAKVKGIDVLAEAFAERRYQYRPGTAKLSLLARAHSLASIDDCDDAVRHAMTMVRHGFVEALVDASHGELVWEKVAMECDTLCVHSDSTIALCLAKRLSYLNKNGWPDDV